MRPRGIAGRQRPLRRLGGESSLRGDNDRFIECMLCVLGPCCTLGPTLQALFHLTFAGALAGRYFQPHLQGRKLKHREVRQLA